MTTLARLEALEDGQVSILKEIADVKEDVGHLTGVVETWIAERREMTGVSDKLAAAMLRECDNKHKTIGEHLADHDAQLNGHETRIKQSEKWIDSRVVGWSTYKKLWVAAASFVAFVGAVFGVAEMLHQWMM